MSSNVFLVRAPIHSAIAIALVAFVPASFWDAPALEDNQRCVSSKALGYRIICVFAFLMFYAEQPTASWMTIIMKLHSFLVFRMQCFEQRLFHSHLGLTT